MLDQECCDSCERQTRGRPEANAVPTEERLRVTVAPTPHEDARVPCVDPFLVHGESFAHGSATRLCYGSEQASHNGELVHAVEGGALARGSVIELGAVLAGRAEGRRSAEEITSFDSTGLAIQDLAIALAAMERADELELPAIVL